MTVESLVPVDPVDKKMLIEHGHHPKYFVKADERSVNYMEAVAAKRLKRLEVFTKFDRELIEIANENLQSRENFVLKQRIRKLVAQQLPKMPGATLHICGSTMNGCGSGVSDVDLCWAIPAEIKCNTDVKYPMDDQNEFKVGPSLLAAKVNLKALSNVQNLDTLFDARVKLLKFDVEASGCTVPVDLNINNVAGIFNTLLLAHWSKIDERFSMLCRIMKRWGKKSGVINSQEKYLNSYTMCLMVAHFLQCGVSPPILPNLVVMYPDIFDGRLPLTEVDSAMEMELDVKMEPYNPVSMGELVFGFLRYYGYFNYEFDSISLRIGSVIKKKGDRAKFMLEEVYDRQTVPKNLDTNRVDQVKVAFIDAHMKQCYDGPSSQDFIFAKKYLHASSDEALQKVFSDCPVEKWDGTF